MPTTRTGPQVSGPALGERVLGGLLPLDDGADGAKSVPEVLEEDVRDALAAAVRSKVVVPALLLLHVQDVRVACGGHV